MRVYISGPMTGLPDLNFSAFDSAERRLHAVGYYPINPARHGQGREWQFYMRSALRDLADAEGVALLPGWENSTGASLEKYVADTLNIPVRPLEEWLDDS